MQELWDLYDIKRNPLGLTHVRGTRMRRGTYHIAVGIWTVNDRDPHHPPFARKAGLA